MNRLFKTLATARWNKAVFVAGSALVLSFAFSLPASAASKISVPTAVRSVQATAGNARAVVKWSAPKSNGGSPIKRYVVTSHPLNMTCITIGAKCAISGLTDGVRYEFTVVADNKVGSSSNSKSSNVVTPRELTIIPISPPSSPAAPSTPTTTTTTNTIPTPSGEGGGGGTTPSSYTVTFNANGSSGSMAIETSSTAVALTTNVLSRTGYTFSGWNTAADGSGTVYADGASYGFGASVTLYAQWSADFFEVTFNANGGSGSMAAQSDNSTTALSTNSFTHTGYTFSGWNTQENGSGTSYGEGSGYSFNAALALYAQWTAVSVVANTYVASFNANGGTGSMSPESSNTGASLSANAFSRSGYTFSGWNTAANGSGTAYIGGANYGFGASVTLYAQWSADFFAVTYNANGGSGSMTAQSDNSTTALSANNFTYSGHKFSGWNTAANGSGAAYAGGASYGFGANVTLYAQWAAASAPVVTLSPISQVVETGNTATFNASASGSPTPSVQWKVSSNGGSTWSAISGATSTSYAVTSTQFVNGYEYEAVFSNVSGSATTGAAQLTYLRNSNNWAGYVDTGGTFSAVSAEWVVPTVTCSGTSALMAVQWVGIDGAGSSTVEQDGTATNCAGATPQYNAWYEMYGDASVNNGYMVTLSTSMYHVSPGDSMTSSVLLSGSQWTLKVVDNSAGWTFSTIISSPNPAPAAVSAEVITESPGVCSGSCSEASLADFGTVTFTNISISSSTTGTGSFTSGNVNAIECNDSNNDVMMSPGILSGGGTSFTDTWFASS